MNKTNIKVLIVDDEPNIVVAVEYLMKKNGYQIETAYNGQDALHTAESFQPDIVILDVMMPGMNGFEVAQQIRGNPLHQNTQIVFLTAKGTTKDKMQGYSQGGDFYITKPFDNHDLVNTIQEMTLYG